MWRTCEACCSRSHIRVGGVSREPRGSCSLLSSPDGAQLLWFPEGRTKARPTEEKQMNWTSSEIKALVIRRSPSRKKSQNRIKYLQIRYLIRNLNQENIKKSNNSVIKWPITKYLKCTQDLNTRFSKEDTQVANKHMKGSVFSYYGNVSQNCNSTRQHTSPDGCNCLKKWKVTSIGEDEEKLEPSCVPEDPNQYTDSGSSHRRSVQSHRTA